MVRRTLGSIRRYALNQLDQPAVILLYHRVTILNSDPQLLAVKPENFHDHISWVKNRYNLLSIEEFTELVTQGKRMPKRAVVITFDDGYADNYLEALPILENQGGQALFYITTSNIGTPYELWWDELERIMLNSPTLPNSLEIDINGQTHCWPTANIQERQIAYHSLHPLLKFLQPQQRDNIIAQLRQWAGLEREGRATHRMLTSDELVKMGQSPSAVIGAHTHNHPALAALSKTEQTEEIGQSKNILEALLQRQIHHFSYPFGGKKDYNPDTVQVCQDAGFRMVCSNYYGQVHRWTDKWQVPRILVRDWNKKEFSDHLSKFFFS